MGLECLVFNPHLYFRVLSPVGGVFIVVGQLVELEFLTSKYEDRFSSCDWMQLPL